MKAFQLLRFGDALVQREWELPALTGTQLLVQVLAAGVCHTDLHVKEGSFDIGDGHSLHFASRGLQLPKVLGHEVVAKVVAVGTDAPSTLVGTTALVYPWIGCGNCPACSAGRENLCATPAFLGTWRDGGYATHMVVPHWRYLVDIGDVDVEKAAPMACSGLTMYSAIKKLGSRILESPVLIIGAGGLGLMGAAIVRALGGAGVVIADIDQCKLDAAEAAGAMATLNVGGDGWRSRAATIFPTGVASVIDCVGNTATSAVAFELVGKGGNIVLVGLFGGKSAWPLPLIALKAVTIQGSYVGNLGELHELMALVRSGAVKSDFVTRFPLGKVNSVMEELAKGRIVGRAVLTPDCCWMTAGTPAIEVGPETIDSRRS
jgi:propanol-preferring alcohol dehydrogenase